MIPIIQGTQSKTIETKSGRKVARGWRERG